MDTRDITPAKFRCGLGTYPSIHETENGIVFVGDFVSDGELKNLGIPRGKGESAVSYPREFVDAFVKECVAKWLANP